MAAEFARCEIGPHDHGERVPARDRNDPFFELKIAGKRRLFFRRYGVAVGRAWRTIQSEAEFDGAPHERREKKRGALGAAVPIDRVERVEPLARFRRIVVGGFDRLQS